MVNQAVMSPGRDSTTRRAFRYATTGLAAEVAFTALRGGAWHLQGHTQLWLAPVYAVGGVLGYERLKEAVRGRAWWARGLVYGCFVVTCEWACGEAYKPLLGACPWAYDASVHPLIISDTANVAYLPLWGALLLAAEHM